MGAVAIFTICLGILMQLARGSWINTVLEWIGVTAILGVVMWLLTDFLLGNLGLVDTSVVKGVMIAGFVLGILISRLVHRLIGGFIPQ
jgi:hypothetical protein